MQDPSFTSFLAELSSLRRVEWADQRTDVPQEINFYQTSGFNWEELSSQSSLHQLDPKELGYYVLSDANVLSFIQIQPIFFLLLHWN